MPDSTKQIVRRKSNVRRRLIWSGVIIVLILVIEIFPIVTRALIELPTLGAAASTGQTVPGTYVPAPSDTAIGTNFQHYISSCNTNRCRLYKQVQFLGQARADGKISRLPYVLAQIGLFMEEPEIAAGIIIVLIIGLGYIAFRLYHVRRQRHG